MTIDPQVAEQARSSDADVRHRAAVQIAEAGEMTLSFELLGDRDWRVRKTIVDGLLRRPDEEVIRELIRALHDEENAGKRNSATEALVKIGPRALPIALDELENVTDPDVRLALINLLGELRSERGLSILLSFLESETDVNILSSAVASIGKYRDVGTVPRLTSLLGQEDLWLKFHVVEALGHIGDRSALPAILPLYAEQSLRKPVLEAIGRIADIGTVSFLLRILSQEQKLNLTAVKALIQVARSDKPKVVEQAERQAIHRAFRESFPASKIGPLVDHLQATPKRDVKNHILTFLGWSGDPRVIPPLLEHVEQPESTDAAAQALIEFGQAAAPAVIERLNSTDDDDVAGVLIRVATLIGGEQAVPALLPFLDHPSAGIRRLAIEGLGETPAPSSIDYLLSRLDDPDTVCQQSAVNSISALVAAYPEEKASTLAKVRKLLGAADIPTKLNSLSIYVNIQGEEYHDELLLASKDEDAVIRQKAISLMGRFSDDLFADSLVLALADEAEAVRLAAIESIGKLRPEKAIDPLISSLEDSDIWIRTAAVQALGEYRHPKGVEPLIRHLDTDVVPVKIAVIEALGKTEDGRVRDALLPGLAVNDPEMKRSTVLALARVPGDDVLERLLESLRDPDWRIRAAAATALGQRGDTRALDAMHEVLHGDSDTFVRQSVVTALGKIGSRASFPHLLKGMEDPAVLDEISHLFVRHREVYRTLLEEAWQRAGSRHEMVIAAILQSMKGAS